MNLRWTLSLVSFVALYGSVARADELECGAAPPNVDLAALPPAQKTEVDERFRRGVEFYQAGDYKLALIEFERVYQIAPSYKYLYNIGQVNLQLNNYARAQIALRDYLCGGGSEIAEARRAEVLGDLEGLRKRTAQRTKETAKHAVADSRLDEG